ncbi:CRISPR-associated helicase/endonuclease Cas3 [Anaerobranca gottschalkii]|uniref:CRISPR-associated helicase, Cas3 family n=1 Tax=Anaerobranca gottschalkii DSM 13577 TaxID=1120990 RepID=A0A1I0A8Q8_9FIRM|nr:CRISPR-associated helicase/endonuclease Cas3 [Anaerobranca gottschalkii]SES90582.1 CRISPR-associated helicase, Cas3 family [Anaerobranca gottschalkii DSM 13577]
MIFYSHINPNKKLIDHLQNVTNLATSFAGENQKAVEIAAKCHDFGKYTTYFQKHLKEGYSGRLSHHSFISALFTAYVAFKELGEENYLPLILYSAVINHHSNVERVNKNLPNKLKFTIDELDEDKKGNIKNVLKQLDDMEKNFSVIYQDLEKIGLHGYFKEFLEQRPIEEVLTKLARLDYGVRKRGKIKRERMYTLHHLIYSALIDGDKLDASNTHIPDTQSLPFNTLIEGYKSKFPEEPKGELNKMRSEIFQRVLEGIEREYKNGRYFSITAPTGSGKTLTGFYAAKRLQQLLGGDRKIIYTLPFTSIIDQNYGEIERLHHQFISEKDIFPYLLKHHHLSDLLFKEEEKSGKYHLDLDQGMLLVEGWHSGMIITTFIQLFESLIGIRNKMLKKYHNIRGSIILIDELQTIDIKYWKLIDYVFKQIAEELDCRIITMTATKPIILQDSIELLKDYQKYFQRFNRVKLEYKDEPMEIEDFIQEFTDSLEDKSYLIICNTINQSLEIYKRLAEASLNRKLLYLSTNIIPKERKKRIEKIKDILNEKPIVVSTQVVEAGVDLDFDVVYRDLAPMDSIVQGAGRCNRNDSREKGIVKVVKMVKGNKRYGGYIYNTIALNITQEILNKSGCYEEKDFLQLIEEYFNSVFKRLNTITESNEIIKGMQEMEMDKVKGFSLIKDRPTYVDVFLEVDEESKDLFEKYKEILEQEFDPIQRKGKLFHLRRKMNGYIVSVPIEFARKELIEEKTMFRMALEQKERLYSDDIGLKRLDLDTPIIF